MLHARNDYERIQDPEEAIPQDEPVFLLRGQDRVAATTVKLWAILHRLYGGNERIARMAEDHARKMEDWPIKKEADL